MCIHDWMIIGHSDVKKEVEVLIKNVPKVQKIMIHADEISTHSSLDNIKEKEWLPI